MRRGQARSPASHTWRGPCLILPGTSAQPRTGTPASTRTPTAGSAGIHRAATAPRPTRRRCRRTRMYPPGSPSEHPPRSKRGRSDRPGFPSDGPGFLAVAHVPEHPLVAARVSEVAVYPGPFGRSETGTHLVGHVDHGLHHRAELLAPVRVDPLPVARVGRAAAQQLLADLPVDPVARQDRADPFGVGPVADGGEQVAGVRKVRRGGFGLLRAGRVDAEVGEQRPVQGLLHRDRVRRVPREHLGLRRHGRPAGHAGQGPGVAAQVDRVLHDVEREGVMREAAVGQTGQERVRQDRVVDTRHTVPQLSTEAVAHRVASPVVAGTVMARYSCRTWTGPSPPPSQDRPCSTAWPAITAAWRAASASGSPAPSPAANAAEWVQPAPCVAATWCRATGMARCRDPSNRWSTGSAPWPPVTRAARAPIDTRRSAIAARSSVFIAVSAWASSRFGVTTVASGNSLPTKVSTASGRSRLLPELDSMTGS